MNTPYAVVTGASRGLGKELAIELARRGVSSIMVGTSSTVETACAEINRQYHTHSVAFIANLCQKEEVLNLAQKINQRYEVFLLVNNAGMGGSKAFTEADCDYLDHIIQLNIRATSLLTHELMPNLLRQPKSYVLNIGSMAAFTATGYKTVYPASKAFLKHFSYGMREEFKDTAVSISYASPGAMATNPEVSARIEKQGFLGKFTLKTTRDIAKKCIQQTLRGKKHIIINPLSYFFSAIIPGCIKNPLMTKIVKRELEK
ncbi:MAG: SDR family NAD(P)-dependent oxidoreductase [Bacteroidales bacterium]|nr:SDR family NAD(P)-dependent oxidoreductase [Bacteroidales bacterium]